jgi:hypothetical protein
MLGLKPQAYLRGKCNGNGKSKGKGNHRSFDCATRKIASYFAQDDSSLEEN